MSSVDSGGGKFPKGCTPPFGIFGVSANEKRFLSLCTGSLTVVVVASSLGAVLLVPHLNQHGEVAPSPGHATDIRYICTKHAW